MTSVLDAINNATPAEGGATQDNPPAPGTYVAVIADAKYATYEKNGATETYAVIEYRTPTNQWSDWRGLTDGGVAQPKRADAFKGLLRSLGLPGPFPNEETLKAQLRTLVGKAFSVDVKQTSAINKNTGEFYVNTYVNGPASAPVQAQAPAPVPQAAPSVVQTPGGPVQFPSAVPVGQVQASGGYPGVTTPATSSGNAVPGAQFGDDIPWDQPQPAQQ